LREHLNGENLRVIALLKKVFDLSFAERAFPIKARNERTHRGGLEIDVAKNHRRAGVDLNQPPVAGHREQPGWNRLDDRLIDFTKRRETQTLCLELIGQQTRNSGDREERQVVQNQKKKERERLHLGTQRQDQRRRDREPRRQDQRTASPENQPAHQNHEQI